MIVTNNIKTYRLKRFMTQQELAEQLGVSRSAVANWENDIRSIDIIMAIRLSDVLGATLDQLFLEQATA